MVSHEGMMRRVLGLGPVRSTFFTVEGIRGADGPVREFIIHGAGWGHGVGLCQSGAAGRAAGGADYRSILAHYYPMAELHGLEESEPAVIKRPPYPKKPAEKTKKSDKTQPLAGEGSRKAANAK